MDYRVCSAMATLHTCPRAEALGYCLPSRLGREYHASRKG
jgi:hypothetical protein